MSGDASHLDHERYLELAHEHQKGTIQKTKTRRCMAIRVNWLILLYAYGSIAFNLAVLLSSVGKYCESCPLLRCPEVPVQVFRLERDTHGGLLIVTLCMEPFISRDHGDALMHFDSTAYCEIRYLIPLEDALKRSRRVMCHIRPRPRHASPHPRPRFS